MTVTTNGTRAPFSLDEARAARAEATEEAFTFSLNGNVYAVKPMTEWPIGAQALLTDGNLAAAVPQLLVGGEATWQELEGQGATLGDLMALFEEVGNWAGTESLPNSVLPSPPASTPT